ALADDLAHYRNGEPVSVHSVNLFDRLARTLERSRDDIEFRSWGTMLLLFAGLILAGHIGILALMQNGPPSPRRWIDLTRLVQFALMGLVFWRTRAHRLLPTSSAERLLWSIWIGYLAANGIIDFLQRHLMARVPGIDELTLYPTRAILAGL